MNPFIGVSSVCSYVSNINLVLISMVFIVTLTEVDLEKILEWCGMFGPLKRALAVCIFFSSLKNPT